MSVRVSVIIANYNYQRFVGRAIESALALKWPDAEVIVVDDGSTDGSRSVIESYAEKGVKAYFVQNGGPSRAYDYGYSKCSGDWVVFLDADDLIYPYCIEMAQQFMVDGCSKIQFRMAIIDDAGVETGDAFPSFPGDLSPALIRSIAERTDAYPTPPTSGNILSRQFLEKIFPLESGMDRAVDSYFLSTAPFLGDVFTVDSCLGAYRVHGKNLGAQLAFNPDKIFKDFERHLTRCAYATRICSQYDVKLNPARWRFGLYNLTMRVSCYKLGGCRIETGSFLPILQDLVRAMRERQGVVGGKKLVLGVWVMAVAVLPKMLAKHLISWRFAPATRPAFLRAFVRAI